jgi:hypothetical protein
MSLVCKGLPLLRIVYQRTGNRGVNQEGEREYEPGLLSSISQYWPTLLLSSSTRSII